MSINLENLPLNSCAGKNVIVTGATGILGEVICHALATSGAQVCVMDLSLDRCSELASALPTPKDQKHIAIACNIADPNQVHSSVQKAINAFGHIHGLLNNAATKTKDLKAFFEPFETYSLDTWREVMSVNIDGMFLMAQAVGTHMVEYEIAGSIVQTSSIYGVVAPDQRIYEGSHYMGGAINTPAVYSASKAAVLGFSKYLASYWGHKKIRVNSLTPGGVESGQNDVFSKKYSARVPLGRMAEKTDIAQAAVFLISDASSYMSGQNMIVDGGLSCW
ncbi:SDR family oxidoreductase [Terasakiella pusilla]|uniref:SDR family oxidoreductase n=1 Tax=Terasakiella pusilla TaxID=64973 RepID=UPI000491E495|nr:SDR family oxidoreductase [Terasakiella pusilla]